VEIRLRAREFPNTGMRILLLFLCFFAPFSARAQNPPAQRVLVVYDPNVADSVSVANHYVASRTIPSGNMCQIGPPETPSSLSWTVFVSTVKTPVQNCLDAVGPDQILYIVLAYVRPFSVTAQNGKAYALDQYLADVWDQNAAGDAFPYPDKPHPYFAAEQPQGNSYEPFVSFADYRAGAGSLQIYSVWRLDGVTAALAEGLVDQAIAAETNGLAGQACLDRRLGAIAKVFDAGDGSGDWELHMAAVFAGQAGFSVTEDSNPQEFGTPPAPDCPDAALYSGWYSLNHYNNAFTWNTGAIGFHLDSESAADPRKGSNWSANAIIHGITVTSGAMAEPYLQGMAQPDGVFLNLFEGANVGDAFLRNTMWLKWMILNMGDPLYLPFPGGLAPFNGANPQSSLVLNPQFPVGPAAATGTVVLASPAPAGGTVVNLKSSKPKTASVPASITVPAGATTANFNIATVATTTNNFVVISASGGTTASNTLGDVPLLGGIFSMPYSLLGGDSVTVAIVLNDYAPVGGTVVTLTNSNPAALPVPASATVAAGSYKTSFSATTNPVSANTMVTITASLNGTKTRTSVTVRKPPAK
jgi:uncharacterized protein (TIGR03790 family)